MYRISKSLLAGFLLTTLMFSACDFPADPPLKSKDGPITPPTPAADTARVLLPLTGAEMWRYLVDVPIRPLPPAQVVGPRVLEIDRQRFFYLPYSFHVFATSVTFFAFPPLLRNDSLGLGFYAPFHPEDTLRLSRMPKHLYTLPWPARRGSATRTSEYYVVCTHTDTLMSVHNLDITLPAYRYEVYRGNIPNKVFYVVPGITLLRIESEEAVFHTVGWRI